MKYLSLLALGSILLLVPACGGCDNGSCVTTSTTTTTTSNNNGTYVDKESLEEQEIVEVMNN